MHVFGKKKQKASIQETRSNITLYIVDSSQGCCPPTYHVRCITFTLFISLLLFARPTHSSKNTYLVLMLPREGNHKPLRCHKIRFLRRVFFGIDCFLSGFCMLTT